MIVVVNDVVAVFVVVVVFSVVEIEASWPIWRRAGEKEARGEGSKRRSTST